MLEKKKLLRKIELTYTNEKVHPECHFEYHNVIMEDGVQISKSVHREVKSIDEAKSLLFRSEIHNEKS